MKAPCAHFDLVRSIVPNGNGCEECLQLGDSWLHLRLCMSCGHVGCCDDSPNRHAAAHFRERNHPIMQSFEPGEDWWFCYIDELVVVPHNAPSFSRR